MKIGSVPELYSELTDGLFKNIYVDNIKISELYMNKSKSRLYFEDDDGVFNEINEDFGFEAMSMLMRECGEIYVEYNVHTDGENVNIRAEFGLQGF